MPRRLLLAVIALLMVAASVAGCGDTGSSDTSVDDAAVNADEFVVGALLDLTGGWATLGKTSQAALDIAVDRVNSEFEANGEDVRVRVVVEDTAGDPDQALDKLQGLAGQGIFFVIGPQSSAEVRAVKDFADENGVVIVSQGSTASDLAVAGDNVLRFIPVGKQESDALTALLEADGIQAVVPIWRDDLGNSDLVATLREATEPKEIFVSEGVSYAAENPDYAAALAEVETQIAATTGRIAVYLAAFSEVADLFEVAAADSNLAGFPWYGSDGVVLIPELVDNAVAAEFAVAVGYPNPIFGLDPAYADAWGPVVEQVEAETGLTAEAFTIAAYDALVVAVDAWQRGAGPESFRGAYDAVAAESTGLNGPTALDSNGDRDTGAFSFYAICSSGDQWEWQIVGSYTPTSSEPLQAMGCP